MITRNGFFTLILLQQDYFCYNYKKYMEQNCNCGCGCQEGHCCKPGWGIKPLIIVVLLILAVYLAGLARNAFRQHDYIGKTSDSVRSMSFSGEGKEVVKPDIALVTTGVEIEKKTVAEAIKEGTDKMNLFVEKALALGIKREDIKTVNYSINPAYDWSREGKQTLRGYTHRQSIELKIRDLNKVSDVLATAGDLGLNQVGDLRFDVDNKEATIAKAREAAIAKAKANAAATSKQLGISLGKLVGYNANEQLPAQIYNAVPMYKLNAAMEAAGAPSPTISEGQSEITVAVSLTYEII